MSKDEAWLLKEKYHGEKTASFFADCDRLQSGEPLAYVIGFIPFLDCQIWLDSKPLIPRSETEYWVEIVIKQMNARREHPLRVLDLCAGSGAIGVAIAKALPHSLVDFIELDERHAVTINKNCQENNLPPSQYRIIISDLFKNIVTGTKYDLIVSNPPYLDEAQDRVADSVKMHEPAIALYGGLAGFELIKQIIEESPEYLVKNGQLWLEHEPEQSEMIKSQAGTRFVTTTFSDQYGLPRFSQLVLQ